MAMKDNKGITVDKDEFTEWFTQIMLKADLADYTEVSGCIVFKPTAYEMWENIRDVVDEGYRQLGIRNAYFPLFIPEKFLNMEKEHVEGFSPEVAWVTHAGNTKLNERLAVRPTSETIMYPSIFKCLRIPFHFYELANFCGVKVILHLQLRRKQRKRVKI